MNTSAGDPAQQARERGLVVAHVTQPADISTHERASLLAFCSQIAALLDWQDGGWFDPASRYDQPLYFVPSATLGADEAQAFGIHGPRDLYGGVVPFGFVATKAVVHPLVGPGAAAPRGWNPDFAERVRDVVLAGYSAFDPDDAFTAGLRLLDAGPVRVKRVRATGGHGQMVVHDAAGLQGAIGSFAASEIAENGVVLEEHLEEIHTRSVGHVRVRNLEASYFGTQRTTPNNAGKKVFGGSDLTLVPGALADLLATDPAREVRPAIRQAAHFHDAVARCFPGFHASRSNYDVLVGRDAGGRVRSGVLEQSWRVGGATGPELAALAAFKQDRARDCVRASSFEFFGASPEPPAGAIVHFRGTDPRSGPLTKYTVVHPDGRPH